MNKYPAVVWNGFHFKWKKWPHRLSVMGSRIVHRYDKARERILAFDHHMSWKHGNFPSEASEYKVPYTLVQTDSAIIARGESEIIDLAGRIEEGISREQPFRVKVNELDFLHNRRNFKLDKEGNKVTVLLNGFHLESSNNRSGWHFGGLGIRLDDARWIDAETLEFTAHLFSRPSRSPELFHHGNKQWNYELDCVYRLVFDYLVITGEGDMLNFTDHTVPFKGERPEIAFTSKRKTTIAGAAEAYPNAFTGVRGFYFKINRHDKALRKKRTGRYVREIGFLADGFHYDPKSGAAVINTGVHFSNKAVNIFNMSNPWMLETTLDLSLIQLGGNAVIQHDLLEADKHRKDIHHAQVIRLNVDE